MNYFAIPGIILEKPPVPIDSYIIELVCEYYKISDLNIKSKSKKRIFTIPRMIAMYFLSKKTKLSLTSIGKMFGGRDHSTVIYAIQTIEDLEFSDKKIKSQLRELNFMLNFN